MLTLAQKPVQNTGLPRSPQPTSPVQESVSTPTNGPGNEPVDREIKNMKAIIAQQSRQITAQGQALADMMAELNALKAKLKGI